MAYQSTRTLKSIYSDVAASYDKLSDFKYDPISRLAVQHLELQPRDKLVDIGAGTGAQSHLIWKKAGWLLK